MTQPSPQADREAFLARARAVGEEGNWFVHETPYGFDWKNPDEETFVRVRLNEDRHEFRTVETIGGPEAGGACNATSRSPSGRWPRGHQLVSGQPARRRDDDRARTRMAEKVPGAVLFAAAMAALALGGLVAGGFVVFVLWALGRLPA